LKAKKEQRQKAAATQVYRTRTSELNISVENALMNVAILFATI